MARVGPLSCIVLAVAGLANPALAAETTERQEGLDAERGHVLLRGAATYRRLFDIPIYAGTVDLGVGAFNAAGGSYFLLGLLRGRTHAGLGVTQLSVGYRGDFHTGRLLFGLSITASHVWIGRVTRGGTIDSFAFGGAIFGGWDLMRHHQSALTLELELAVDAPIGHDVTLVWGPELGVAYRF